MNGAWIVATCLGFLAGLLPSARSSRNKEEGGPFRPPLPTASSPAPRAGRGVLLRSQVLDGYESPGQLPGWTTEKRTVYIAGKSEAEVSITACALGNWTSATASATLDRGGTTRATFQQDRSNQKPEPCFPRGHWVIHRPLNITAHSRAQIEHAVDELENQFPNIQIRG